MIEVVIVDDESAARRTLRECCGREPDLHIAGEYADGRSALAAILANPPDLLFLDIQIDTVNGIALARSLDQQNLPDIVFVTAYDSYALQAFEVCASDYLLKPFDYERFKATVARVRRKRDALQADDRRQALLSVVSRLERDVKALADTSPRIIAESGSSMHILNIADIELVEGDRNYVKFTVGRAQYHARSTLQQAEISLRSQPMLRISRSCLINVNFIRELSRTPRGDFIFVLACGTTVTSSEGHRNGVREHLNGMKVGTG
ncbi:MAG TPA: LytTR family DNA-binding domain-containing protein [Steroidobacteraceae bacterium]|jgi:two-component system LytT family response regulator|nr:LytTR family DNA-binding domain-containing protein [Steroidobacteraceae bacterium]